MNPIQEEDKEVLVMPAKKIIFSLLFFIPQAYALVDYSEEESFKPQVSGASSVSNAAPTARSVTKPTPKSKGSGMSSLGFNLGTSYGTQDVELQGKNGKVDTMGFELQVQTRYNVFLSASYFQAKSSSQDLVTQNTGFQSGNPEVLLGFNWLQFGKKSELATIDLYGGLAFGQTDSEFATERTDKVVGVTTAKRFHNFALGLGYEYRMTGTGAEDELRIGNISKLSASLGWVVSRDIRFLVEGSTYSIGESNDNNAPNRLEEKVNFSTVKPQLQLKLSPLVDLTLGARFRSRRLREGTLVGARLWNLDGAYGNGVFTGLSISI